MTDIHFDPSLISDPEERRYQINTGDIFLQLQDRWKEFDREFLKTHVKDALQECLLRKGVITYNEDDGDIKYFERARTDLHEYEESSGRDGFPIPEYFINQETLIDYKEEVVLEKGEAHFNLFFALQLSLLPLMEVRQFLQFHLERSFKGDTTSFQTFIIDLVRAYPPVFQNQNIEVAQEFIQQLPITTPQTLAVPQEQRSEEQASHVHSKEYTTHRQCLAMYFLLSSHGLFDKTGELKDGILKKDIHEFIAFFTGKHPDNIKKTFKALFTKEDLLDDNLRFIRPYFEKLQLEEAVNQINRQLKG